MRKTEAGEKSPAFLYLILRCGWSHRHLQTELSQCGKIHFGEPGGTVELAACQLCQ
jgi:hypothetical protein